MFSGGVRNYGIGKAKGDYIVYLDVDDIWGENHLSIIDRGLKDNDWVFFNDIRYDKRQEIWYENKCDVDKLNKNGTSNICHKRSIPVSWGDGYAHDFHFIEQLKRSGKYSEIECGEYYVCHVPNSLLGRGYDL